MKLRSPLGYLNLEIIFASVSDAERLEIALNAADLRVLDDQPGPRHGFIAGNV